MENVLQSLIVVFICFLHESVQFISTDCRDRSNTFRQDGSHCFELPAWQHKPVALEQHIEMLKDRWQVDPQEPSSRMLTETLVNNEINRYMETVLFPFLDTYHKNIQHSYQQLTQKILKKIKEEINIAVHKKQEIYDQLMRLADDLHVPEFCDEERRLAKTMASKHVALIYACTEEARKSITKMGKYADQMIGITKSHMQESLENTTKSMQARSRHPSGEAVNTTTSIQELASFAVKLGYELDLSLTNARRHNEQSCEKLINCCASAKKSSEDEVAMLQIQFKQCVYA